MRCLIFVMRFITFLWIFSRLIIWFHISDNISSELKSIIFSNNCKSCTDRTTTKLKNSISCRIWLKMYSKCSIWRSLQTEIARRKMFRKFSLNFFILFITCLNILLFRSIISTNLWNWFETNIQIMSRSSNIFFIFIDLNVEFAFQYIVANIKCSLFWW